MTLNCPLAEMGGKLDMKKLKGKKVKIRVDYRAKDGLKKKPSLKFWIIGRKTSSRGERSWEKGQKLRSGHWNLPMLRKI